MLKVMKKKALELDTSARNEQESPAEASPAEGTEGGDSGESAVAEEENEDGGGPKYKAIVAAMQALKPSSLSLVDNSHQHAGHAGNDSSGDDAESHFELNIVAEAFEGLSLVQRHQLIYMLLGDIMPQIHALGIKARTAEEAEVTSN